MKPLSVLALVSASVLILITAAKEIISTFPPYQTGQCIRYVCAKNGVCELDRDSLWLIHHNDKYYSLLVRLNQKDKNYSDQVAIGFTKLRSFPFQLEECPNEAYITFDVDTDI